jgi:hypothetical protein
MKRTQTKPMLWAITLALLASVQLTSAFYDPTVQRWINRDPLVDDGFKLLGARGPFWESHAPNSFTFVANGPMSHIDPLGLYLWGKNCSSTDKSKIQAALAARCVQAKRNNCFRCFSNKLTRGELNKFCEDDNSRNVTIRCDDASSNGACKNTGTCGNSAEFSFVIHLCMNNFQTGVCKDFGCTTLHEAGHAIGGVGDDTAINGDNRAYAIEKCAGCPVDPQRPLPQGY